MSRSRNQSPPRVVQVRNIRAASCSKGVRDDRCFLIHFTRTMSRSESSSILAFSVETQEYDDEKRCAPESYREPTEFSSAALSLAVKKQEDLDNGDPKSGQKSDQKPVVRTLNRVPRKSPFQSSRQAKSDRIHRDNSRCLCESQFPGCLPPIPVHSPSTLRMPVANRRCDVRAPRTRPAGDVATQVSSVFSKNPQERPVSPARPA